MKTLIKAVSILSALASTMVLAQDIKTYPGSICKAYHGTDASKVFFSSGAITTKAGMSIECPLLRDVPENTKGVAVVVWGSKGSGSFGCSFRSHSYGGSSVSYYNLGQTSYSGSFALSAAIPGTPLYGNFSLYCSAPPGVSIKQIRVTEAYN